MLKISVIAVGRIKEKYLVSALDEYRKRLSSYCRLYIREVQDESTPDGASPAQEEMIKDREGDRILKAIPEGAYVVSLAIEGNMPDSPELAGMIEKLSVGGESHLVFIIGGSLGLSDRVLDISDMKLSFSKMTFPHQLMRVILLEQIYRSFRIMRGEPYHK